MALLLVPSWLTLIPVITVFLCYFTVHAFIGNFGHVPLGVNPTLYDIKADPIIQLDEMTFNDTIFAARLPQKLNTAYVVEFYSDWCGHCRAFAHYYKQLAHDIEKWNQVVRLAAINCADPLNEVTCTANNIAYFPLLKYFPRNSTNPKNAEKMKSYFSNEKMQEEIMIKVLKDHSINHYDDWPSFDFLNDALSQTALWAKVKPTVQLIMIVFENKNDSYIGAQLLLDMNNYRDYLAAFRSDQNHPIANSLNLVHFPTVVVFKRGENEPVLVTDMRQLIMNKLENFLKIEDLIGQIDENVIVNQSLCETDLIKCQKKFFVSESDMLKAMHYATYIEVTRGNTILQGSKLDAIENFFDLLVKNFPQTTLNNASEESTPLANSKRAVAVFKKMRDLLSSKKVNDSISIAEYKKAYKQFEEENEFPFPTEANWEHCAGSNPDFRGYTCGLWTTLHALTIQAYKNGVNGSENVSIIIEPLKDMQSWVDYFFGCRHCRDHFIKMTTKTFPIETHVHRPEDVFIYLWQAHNIVNARLRNSDTEDPEFPKRQFPADFLCADCRQKGHFDQNQVKNFLLQYYSAIKPFDSLHHSKSN